MFANGDVAIYPLFCLVSLPNTLSGQVPQSVRSFRLFVLCYVCSRIVYLYFLVFTLYFEPTNI